MVTVIIATINDPYLFTTIRNVKTNASEDIEILVVNDGGKSIPLASRIKGVRVIDHEKTLGRRVSINEAARAAQGDYLFILDAHCTMSVGWDERMRESCKEKDLVYCVIVDVDPSTWQHRPGAYLHVQLDPSFNEKWWNRRRLNECSVEEESMAFTGCAWMIRKGRYWQLGGYDESLGQYGWDGPEWACKVWLGEDPGRVILRTDVICGHVFGTNVGGALYRSSQLTQAEYTRRMLELYRDKIWSLVKRFDPPLWRGMTKEQIGEIKMAEQKKERVVIIKTDNEIVDRDSDGRMIGKRIEHYQATHKDDGSGPTEQELVKMYKDKMILINTEIISVSEKEESLK